MSKRAVAVLTVLLAVGFVFAEWHEVAGGSGKARVRILEQNNTGTTFEVTVPGVEITTKEVDGEEFAVVTLPGGHTAHLVNGRPQVPVVPVLLAIPNGATVSFHVEAKETQKLRVARIFPLQPLPPWGHEPGPFVFDRDFYIEDVSYPGEDAGSVHTAVWRDLNVANIRVYPVRVSPAQGEIEVASRIRVRVNYSGGTYPTTIADWMMPQYARLVDNFAQLSVQPTDDDPNATKYLVFCHSQYQFSPALEELLDWVNHRGYKVEEYYGDDFTPLWIKQKIWEVYGNTQGQLRWVLLVGEYDEVPVKEVPSPVQNLEPISCDYWYTDLLPYPPPSEEVDYHPEIGIARLSPGGDNSGERLQDLEHQIEKILNYQRNPDTHENTGLDWLTRMQLVAGMGHEHAAELCMLRLMDPAQTPLPYYAYDRCFISGYDTYEGSLDVQNALREGRGVLVYFGHGWIGHWDRWYQPQTNTHWEIRHIAETENLGLTPVVYQMACHCGSVQEPECLSEGWMREYRDDPGGGAVACLGATHYAWSEEGENVDVFVWALGGNDEFEEIPNPQRPEQTYNVPVFDIGGIKMLQDAYFIKIAPGYSRYKHTIIAHLFLGEPSMPVWSGGVPKMPTVVYPHSIPPDGNMPVTVEVDGRPVMDALVCAWSESGVYETARTDEDGIATLTILNPPPGEIHITVSEGHATDAPHTPILPFESRQWTEVAEMPSEPSGEPVKRGGWLAYNPGNGLIYAAKGNETYDFYKYNLLTDEWTLLDPMPEGGRPPKKGCRGVADGGSYVYMTKGNKTLEFWRFDINAPPEDPWKRMPDVPEGNSGRKVRGGTDLVYVTIGDVGYVYLLKGYKCEFYRYNTNTGVWHALADAPTGIKQKWERGSWIVYDGENTIYAHKGKHYDRTKYTHELWKYDIGTGIWGTTSLAGMPLYGLHNGRIKKKKATDGGAGAMFGDRIYAVKGGNTQQFWMYDISGDSWAEFDTVPRCGSTGKRKRVRYGADIVNVGSAFYALKGNKTREFWRCAPGIGGGFFGGGYAARPRRRTGRRAGLTPFTIPGRTRPGLRSALGAGQSILLPGLVRAPGRDQPKRPGGGPRTDVDTVFDVLTEFAPAWSPDGQWLAYSRYDPEFGWDRLFQYNPWTGEEFPIDQPDAHCNRPAWSPSGEWVAYEVDDFGSGFTQVWRSCVTGTISEVMPMTCQPIDHFNVQFSPCGKFLVYEADLPDFSQIHMVPFEAPFMELQITREPRDHYNPRPYWSLSATPPPGRGGIEPGPANIWDVVYEREDEYFTQICWTPDGATAPYRPTVEEYQLTFREVDHTNPCPPNCSTDVVFQAEDDEFGMEQIWKVRLWEPGAEELLVLDEDADFGHPDMSPDGGMVACDRDLYDGSIVIYGIDLYGRMSGELTDPDAIRTWPKFSPGGEAIAVSWELMAGEGGGVLSAGTMPGQDYRFRQVTANPAVGNIGVRWHMPYPGHVRIAVYDKVGRLVKLMRDEEASAGSGHAVWDRTDRYGRRVATGVYFCDFRAGEYRSRKKFVLMK